MHKTLFSCTRVKLHMAQGDNCLPLFLRVLRWHFDAHLKRKATIQHRPNNVHPHTINLQVTMAEYKGVVSVGRHHPSVVHTCERNRFHQLKVGPQKILFLKSAPSITQDY